MMDEYLYIKINLVDVLEDIHASRMGTIKWNLLDHVFDDMARIGGLYVNDAGL